MCNTIDKCNFYFNDYTNHGCKNLKTDIIKPNGNVTEPDGNNGKPNCGAIMNVFLVHLLWICLLTYF